jgi:hypothetical protein
METAMPRTRGEKIREISENATGKKSATEADWRNTNTGVAIGP